MVPSELASAAPAELLQWEHALALVCEQRSIPSPSSRHCLRPLDCGISYDDANGGTTTVSSSHAIACETPIFTWELGPQETLS